MKFTNIWKGIKCSKKSVVKQLRAVFILIILIALSNYIPLIIDAFRESNKTNVEVVQRHSQIYSLNLNDLYQKQEYVSYEVSKVVLNSQNHIKLQLTYVGFHEYLQNRRNKIIRNLLFQYRYLEGDQFFIKIKDRDEQRWEIPDEYPFPENKKEKESKPLFDQKIPITIQFTKEVFSFTILRKGSNEIIFDTRKQPFIFSNHYIEITTKLASDFLIGLGERNTNYVLNQGYYTIWNRDRPWLLDDGVFPAQQTYGAYPVYMMREGIQRNFHISYLKNSNAMDLQYFCLEDREPQQCYLKYQITGGILNFHFFLGEKQPQQLTEKFHQFLGGWIMPPFWSFGFHQSRWGYKNISMLREVIDKHEQAKIPLDSIWSDLDYMLDKVDFSVDEEAFPLKQLQELTDRKKYIVLIDAGIAVNQNTTTYTSGIEKNVFIQNTSDLPLKGWVWPGAVHYPDYFNPNTSDWWQNEFAQLYQKVEFAGVWLDMNEVSNFCQGQCPISEETMQNAPNHFDYSQDLPYQIGKENIETMTLSCNASHYGNHSQFNVHNLFGLMQSESTYQYLLNQMQQIPFIITRSTYPGTGRFAFHWTGDNVADYKFLKISIGAIFNFNFFGIPMTGADICGFSGNTTQDLCSRWVQLGALYPFARNHNSHQCEPQQFYALGKTVEEAARVNFGFRYAFLRQFYTEFLLKGGKGSVFKPLFYVFPDDDNLFSAGFVDELFMIGNQFLFAPILKKDEIKRDIVLPKSFNWYQFNFLTEMIEIYQGGFIGNISNLNKEQIPFFIREGSILFMEDSKEKDVLSTKDLQGQYIMYVFFDDQGMAEGAITPLMFKDKDELKYHYVYPFKAAIAYFRVHKNVEKLTIQIQSQSNISDPGVFYDETVIKIQKMVFYDYQGSDLMLKLPFEFDISVHEVKSISYS